MDSHSDVGPQAVAGYPAMRHAAWVRGSGRFVVLFVAVFTAVLLYVGWTCPSVFLVDDAHFYLCVGRNLAEGLGSTFGGVTSTNGYHPLWQWCVAGIYLVVGNDDLLVLRVGVWVNVVMIAASLLMVWRLACRLVPAHLAAASPLLFAFAATRNSYLLETWAYVTLALMLALGTARLGGIRTRRALSTHIVLGVLAGAIILARLDSVLLIASWFAFVGWDRLKHLGPREAIRAGLIEGLCVLAIVMPYVAGNLIHFGHAGTISALVKTSFPRPTAMGVSNPRFLALTLPGVVLGVLFLARGGLWVGFKRDGVPIGSAPGVRLALRVLIVGMLLRTLAIYLFSNFRPWLASYWIDAVLCASVLLPGLSAVVVRFLSGSARARRRRWNGVVVALLYVLPLLWHALNVFCAVRVGSARLASQQALGRWYSRMIPPDAVVFQRDHIGIPTFWSHRRVLDGGGLMNNMEFQRVVTEGRLVSYLRAHRVAYVMSDELEWLDDAPALLAADYEFARYPIRSALTHASTDLLLRREWETGRYRFDPCRKSPTGASGAVQTFCVWKLPESW